MRAPSPAPTTLTPTFAPSPSTAVARALSTAQSRLPQRRIRIYTAVLAHPFKSEVSRDERERDIDIQV